MVEPFLIDLAVLEIERVDLRKTDTPKRDQGSVAGTVVCSPVHTTSGGAGGKAGCLLFRRLVLKPRARRERRDGPRGGGRPWGARAATDISVVAHPNPALLPQRRRVRVRSVRLAHGGLLRHSRWPRRRRDPSSRQLALEPKLHHQLGLSERDLLRRTLAANHILSRLEHAQAGERATASSFVVDGSPLTPPQKKILSVLPHPALLQELAGHLSLRSRRHRRELRGHRSVDVPPGRLQHQDDPPLGRGHGRHRLGRSFAGIEP